MTIGDRSRLFSVGRLGIARGTIDRPSARGPRHFAFAIMLIGLLAALAPQRSAIESSPLIAGPTEVVRAGLRPVAAFGGRGGGAIDVADGVAYVGMGPRLVAFDVTDPALPTIRGELRLPWALSDVRVSGPTAFATTSSQSPPSSLFVMDVSDPASMHVAREIRLGESSNARSLAVDDRAIYIAASDGLWVSALDGGEAVGPAASHGPAWGYSVAIEGNKLYMGHGNGLSIHDITKALSPRMIGSWLHSARRPGVVFNGLAIREGIVYASKRPTFSIWDLRDPSRPRSVASIDAGNARTVRLHGDTALVTGSAVSDTEVSGVGAEPAFLHAFNISDPERPTRTSSLPLPSAHPSLDTPAMDMEGSIAWLSADGSDLHAIDVTDPAGPVVVGETEAAIGGADDAARIGEALFLLDYDTVIALRLTADMTPIVLGRLSIGGLRAGGSAGELIRDGVDQLVVTGPGAGLVTIDASDPAALREIDRIGPAHVEPALDVGEFASYAREGDRAWTSVDGLLVELDVSAVGEKRVAATLAMPPTIAGINALIPADPFVLGATNAGLGIFDMRSPGDPRWMSEWPGAPLSAVERRGDIVYGAGDALHVIGLANPRAPREIVRLDLPERVNDLVLDGELLWALDVLGRVTLYDVREATAPRPIQRLATSSRATRFAVAGEGRMLVAAGNDGAMMLEATTLENAVFLPRATRP